MTEFVFLPARWYDYTDGRISNGCVAADDMLRWYLNMEFPLLSGSDLVTYSVPSRFSATGPPQASEAERRVFERLRAVRLPGLQMIFFQGRHYAGTSRSSSNKLTTRENDFVVFTKYKDGRRMAMLEVKSSARQPQSGVEKLCNSKKLNDNRRTARHQLLVHREMLQSACVKADSSDIRSIGCHVVWPFLLAAPSWQDDEVNHVFSASLSSQEVFNDWLLKYVLNNDDRGPGGSTMRQEVWEDLLKRFIALSCGTSLDGLYGKIDDILHVSVTDTVMLLSQNQLHLLRLPPASHGDPLVIHGAAGTGKTLLVLKKLLLLRDQGQLSPEHRALYLCYWPGIRDDVRRKLKLLGLENCVDTQRMAITTDWFICWCKKQAKGYKHVFVDEMEVIRISPIAPIMYREIKDLYHRGNIAQYLHRGTKRDDDAVENSHTDSNLSCDLGYSSQEDGASRRDSYDSQSGTSRRDSFDSQSSLQNVNPASNVPGHFWVLIDGNQTMIFNNKDSLANLQTPAVVLDKVYRTTGNVFSVFKNLYAGSSALILGHNLDGPPVFWVNTESFNSLTYALAAVIIDLTASKGMKARDVCVMPFYDDGTVDTELLNNSIKIAYQPGSLIPVGERGAERISDNSKNTFCVTWLLRMKGLETKVAIVVIEADDVDLTDPSHRSHLYTMVSRCTCLLIILSQGKFRSLIKTDREVVDYPFSQQVVDAAVKEDWGFSHSV